MDQDGTAELSKEGDGTAESQETHIKTITIDGTELDTCNKCSYTKEWLHLVSIILSGSSKVRESLTKHLKKNIAFVKIMFIA